MDTLLVILQVVIALGILNVWLFRFEKASAWRGGAASNMKEEFAVYGLPPWALGVIGSLKLLCAAGLIVGIWMPEVAKASALVLAVLMLGAAFMHVKVKDPVQRALPALSMLGACLLVVSL